MEQLRKIKKGLIIILTGLAGVLLTLAGLSLIQFSSSLFLAVGITLLTVAFLIYLAG